LFLFQQRQQYSTWPLIHCRLRPVTNPDLQYDRPPTGDV
jgi:hypothetical protein